MCEIVYIHHPVTGLCIRFLATRVIRDERHNGAIGLSLNARKFCIICIFLDRTFLALKNSPTIKTITKDAFLAAALCNVRDCPVTRVCLRFRAKRGIRGGPTINPLSNDSFLEAALCNVPDCLHTSSCHRVMYQILGNERNKRGTS